MQTTQIEVPNEFVPQVRAFLNDLLVKGLKIHSVNKQSEKTINNIKTDDTDDLVNINFFDEKEWLENMDNLLETSNTINQSSPLQEMFQLMDKAFETSEIKNEKLTKRDWTREELYRV